MRTYTRRFTPARATGYCWFVIVGDDCERTEEVWATVPDETHFRRLLRIPADVPILIGRP